MYGVVFSYSFDDDVSIYLKSTLDEAKRFLKESYEEELRIDVEENGWNSEGFIDENRMYAEIKSYFDDGDNFCDITRFEIGNVYR